MEDAINRISRRVQSSVGIGRIATGEDAGNVQTVQVKLGGNEIHDDTPRLSEFGLASVPPNGADVVVLFVGGDRSNGVVIATGDISTRMKNLAPGESALYSADGKHVYLKNGQIEIDAKNQPVNIINASAVTITSSGPITLNGNLKVNGIITASGTITPNVP